MQEKKKGKGKQLIGLLLCLIIGGAALGIGVKGGVFNSVEGAFSAFRNIDVKSVLLRLADDVKIDIRGGLVNMTVCKSFSH